MTNKTSLKDILGAAILGAVIGGVLAAVYLYKIGGF